MDVVCGQHGGVVDEGVVQIALAFLAAHRAAVAVGRQGVGELVFVHVEVQGNPRPGQSQEGGNVEHVGGQDEVRPGIFGQVLAGQGHRAAVHAPFPEAGGQREQLHLVLAVLLVASGPGPVAAAVVGGDEEDFGTHAGWSPGVMPGRHLCSGRPGVLPIRHPGRCGSCTRCLRAVRGAFPRCRARWWRLAGECSC